MTTSKLDRLRELLGEIADINSTVAMLHWDMETYMPPKAAPSRSLQLATMTALSHRAFTSPEMGNLLRDLRNQCDSLSADDAKLVSETLHDYERATKLPEAFVHEFSMVQTQAYHAWVKARQESNYAVFQPHLDKLVQLQKRKADYLGYSGSPYNALLDEYERGMTAERLKPLFAELAQQQSALVEKIVHSPRQPDTSWLNQDWNKDSQWKLTIRALQSIGFDFEAGRQDRSVHPFTTNFDIDDVRLTTRINHRDLFSALMSSIHEGGHGLYEQGLNPEDRRTTLGQAISLGVHESQSRLWENAIGRSLPFWRYFMPVLRELFPGQLDCVAPEQIYAALNRVQPSLIRVEADECTYNLHIILRFEIELALIEGTIDTRDIPELWNTKIKSYLGLDVPSDAEGCLQDIHWSHGSMGYFPTYTLGNLYAAQMFEMILREIPDLWEQIAHGSFTPLLSWLRTNVHRHGRRKTAPELIRDISGSEPDSRPYLNYLEKKYGVLYGI